MLKKPARGDTLLDLIHTSEEDLVSDTKVRGSLGCSDHEMEDFRILREQNNSSISWTSREPTLASSETCLEESHGIQPWREEGFRKAH